MWVKSTSDTRLQPNTHSAAVLNQHIIHTVSSSLAENRMALTFLQTCQHFRALLDEDGLKQLDEGLAWYAAAQVAQPPQMPFSHMLSFVHGLLAIA